MGPLIKQMYPLFYDRSLEFLVAVLDKYLWTQLDDFYVTRLKTRMIEWDIQEVHF